MMALAPLKRYAAEQRWQFRHWRRRQASRAALPPLDPRDRPLLDALDRDGGVVTSLDALGIPGSAAMLEAGDLLFEAIADRAPTGKGGFGVQASAAEIGRHPALLAWGLDPRLLGLVAAHIGLPVAYRGLTLRRDIAGGAKTETRLLHRDNEDVRIVKAIVYLNDVGEDGGPFEFVPKPAAPPTWRVPLDNSRVDDATFDRLVPRAAWRTCTGRRGTVVITDTCQVWHRGRVATGADRRAIFFCYNSSEPMVPQWCAPLFDRRAFLAAAPGLGAMQRAALDPPYAPLDA